MSDLITIEEVAEMVNVPVNTVRHWKYNNKTEIRFARIGKRVMARRSDVEAWINAQFGE